MRIFSYISIINYKYISLPLNIFIIYDYWFLDCLWRIITIINGQENLEGSSGTQDEHSCHKEKAAPRRRALLWIGRGRRRPLSPRWFFRRRWRRIRLRVRRRGIVLSLTSPARKSRHSQYAISREKRHEDELPHQPQEVRIRRPLLGTTGPTIFRRPRWWR